MDITFIPSTIFDGILDLLFAGEFEASVSSAAEHSEGLDGRGLPQTALLLTLYKSSETEKNISAFHKK